MAKLNLKAPGTGPISKKVLSDLKKYINKKVIDLSEWKSAQLNAENLERTIISDEQLSELDPLHGVYVYGQNKISVFVEQLSELPALSKLTNAYNDGEDIYCPSGPPMSPLTASYFSWWGFFDLCAGIQKESFGTIIIDLCKSLGMNQGLIKIFECMQNSRMGIYLHEGFSEKFVLLKELITEKRTKVIVPSGYLGERGEIWFIRVIPEPFSELNYAYSVVVTTPYIMSEMIGDKIYSSSERNWLSFFERTLEKTRIKGKVHAYEYIMKYGLNRHYWNEYIFEGYVNHKHEMIILAGFPDIPMSRPHSKETEERE
jgi:hypothetical protein